MNEHTTAAGLETLYVSTVKHTRGSESLDQTPEHYKPQQGVDEIQIFQRTAWEDGPSIQSGKSITHANI